MKADIRERMEITQADRDAAADYSFKHENPVWWLPEAICNGQEDEAPLVQAFARHRQQSTAALLADMQEPTPEMVEAVARSLLEVRDLEPNTLHQHHEWEDWPVDKQTEHTDFDGNVVVTLMHYAWRKRVPEATTAIRAIAAHLEQSK